MLKVKQNSKWWQRIYLIFIQFLFLIHKQIKAIKWFELVYRGALWLFLCFWASEKSDFWYEEQRSVCVCGVGGGGVARKGVGMFMCKKQSVDCIGSREGGGGGVIVKDKWMVCVCVCTLLTQAHMREFEISPHLIVGKHSESINAWPDLLFIHSIHCSEDSRKTRRVGKQQLRLTEGKTAAAAGCSDWFSGKGLRGCLLAQSRHTSRFCLFAARK